MQKSDQVESGINLLAKNIHLGNKEKGFWDTDRNVGEMLMLVTSELGEAMDAHQCNKFASITLFNRELEVAQKIHDKAFEMAFKIHIKDTFEDEIADAIIRLLDMAAGLNIDIEKHIALKLRYNKSRPRLHGKAY